MLTWASELPIAYHSIRPRIDIPPKTKNQKTLHANQQKKHAHANLDLLAAGADNGQLPPFPTPPTPPPPSGDLMLARILARRFLSFAAPFAPCILARSCTRNPAEKKRAVSV